MVRDVVDEGLQRNSETRGSTEVLLPPAKVWVGPHKNHPSNPRSGDADISLGGHAPGQGRRAPPLFSKAACHLVKSPISQPASQHLRIA